MKPRQAGAAFTKQEVSQLQTCFDLVVARLLIDREGEDARLAANAIVRAACRGVTRRADLLRCAEDAIEVKRSLAELAGDELRTRRS